MRVDNINPLETNRIPISWDTEEIAYYVGFQVDLVDQPTAILDRMKDGTCECSLLLDSVPDLQRLTHIQFEIKCRRRQLFTS